jgi:UDP:flavonoid glycosyltransferase YjiC (YdhE family)
MTKSANILIILPIPAYNHIFTYRILWNALSQRGHKVVVVTTNSITDSNLTNITEINLQLDYTVIHKQDYIRNPANQTWLHALHDHMWLLSQKLVTIVYEHPHMRKMYAPDSDERFDAVMVELLMTPGLYPLAHRFNAPLIGK